MDSGVTTLLRRIAHRRRTVDMRIAWVGGPYVSHLRLVTGEASRLRDNQRLGRRILAASRMASCFIRRCDAATPAPESFAPPRRGCTCSTCLSFCFSGNNQPIPKEIIPPSVLPIEPNINAAHNDSEWSFNTPTNTSSDPPGNNVAPSSLERNNPHKLRSLFSQPVRVFN